MDAASSIQLIAKQENYLTRKFPVVPTHLGLSPVYSSGLQQSAMSAPSAAISLYPMLETPKAITLSALLTPKEPEPEEAEPPPPPEEVKGGKKK